MQLLCNIGIHSWDFCKCRRCGKKKDEAHNWQGCKCASCGKTRDEGHNWQGCKCKVCGRTRDEEHAWQDCKCSICGKEDPFQLLLALNPPQESPRDYSNDTDNWADLRQSYQNTNLWDWFKKVSANWTELCQSLQNINAHDWFDRTKEVKSRVLRKYSIVQLVDALYPLLRSRDEDFKLSAIAILLQFKYESGGTSLPENPQLVEILIAALSAKASKVRYNAAAVLADMKDARAIEPLTALMRSDSDREVRERAQWSIKAIGKDIGAGTKAASADVPAISGADIQKMTDTELIHLLRDVAKACDDSTLAADHLDTPEKKAATARHIGEKLNALGGFARMRRALDADLGWIPGCRTIEGLWNGIGEWLG